MLKELAPLLVERVWGRTDLPAWAAHGQSLHPTGEIWFEDVENERSDLLIKYLFTAEPLSVQVHPTDRAARVHGHASGKSEAWFILDAEPDAVIGLGFKTDMSESDVRESARDGTIVARINWRKVSAGELIYCPAGTVHAIGKGLSIIEIQQNLDITYRLFDFDRGRDLHLDEAIAVMSKGVCEPRSGSASYAFGRQILFEGGPFVVERWSMPGRYEVVAGGTELLLIPIGADVLVGEESAGQGSVWSVRERAGLEIGHGGDLIVAYSGSASLAGLLEPAIA